MKDAGVIDLFCGIGGLAHGFVKEGFSVVAGYDTDATCKYAFESNNLSNFLQKDVADVSGTELLSFFGNSPFKILIGCAPCTPFSKYSNPKKRSEKWRLLYSFSRLIEETRPDVVTMENVPQLAKYQVYRYFVDSLARLGYFVSTAVIRCEKYGVPQTRKRLVLLASRFGKIEMLPPTHADTSVTVRDTIGNLPSLHAGETSKCDKLHTCRNLSAINLQRIRNTPEGGSWTGLDRKLIAKCHRKESGKTYSGVYARMSWDRPGPTITTQCIGFGNGRFGHPEQDRAITLREAALLQTFPRSYRFSPSSEMPIVRRLARHIGNAVPVRLGQLIARSIKTHLKAIDGPQ